MASTSTSTSTSSQPFPILRGPLDASQTNANANANASSHPATCSDWYSSGTYAYNDSYMTPFPSSTLESQPWTQYARSSVPAIFNPIFQQPQPQPSHHPAQHVPQLKDQSRPRSSPSTFGPTPENITWTSTNGLGIQYSTTTGEPTPATSTFPPNVFHTYPIDENYATSSPPEIRQPQPRKPYTSIAPNPAGMVTVKRLREEEEAADSSASSSAKRRKRTSSVASADLNDDDRFLVQLKEDENLPWKEIAGRFQSDKGKNFQVAALQMRYKRLREKFRIWEDQDLQALKLAVEYWEKYKWEIISAKMPDFGIQERWPARHCARKWQTLEATPLSHSTTTGLTPSMSTPQFPSPTEPTHFAFMPLQ